MARTKGQAAAAAALLAIIAGLITLYILFIPPDERERILRSPDSSSSSSTRIFEKNITLLREAPGRIDFLSQRKVEHALPATHIYTRTSGTLIERKDSISIRRSLFSSLDADVDFIVDTLDTADNFLLSFNVVKGRGTLSITLNGETIFTREISTTNVGPITLPKKLLTSDNTLLFSVSSPGAAFWRTHEYMLEHIQVTADITRTDAQRSKSVFLIPVVEFNNLERASVKFQPDCDPDTSGPLHVWVNQYQVYSSVPDCGVGRLSIEFPPSHLSVGENTVGFGIERGDYDISHIAVESELKKIDFPVFFFDLSQERFLDIRNGTRKIVVRLDFVDTFERKSGELIVNGHTYGIDTKDTPFEVDISRDVVRGNNGMKIRPERTLDVRQLTVVLVK